MTILLAGKSLIRFCIYSIEYIGFVSRLVLFKDFKDAVIHVQTFGKGELL